MIPLDTITDWLCLASARHPSWSCETLVQWATRAMGLHRFGARYLQDVHAIAQGMKGDRCE